MRNLIYIALWLFMITAFGCNNRHEQQQAQAVERWENVRTGMAVDLAKQQLENGELQQAYESALSAIEIAPNSVNAQMILGRVYLEQDRLNMAQRCFEHCLVIDPQNANAAYNLGIVYQRWGNKQRSFDYYLQAYNLNPGSSAYVVAAADMYAQRDEPTQALQMIDNYIAQSGPEVPLLIAAGNIYTAQGSHAQAITRYRQALQIGGANSIISESLAYALLAAGRTSAALAVFEQIEQDTAGTDDETLADYSLVKGRCYLQMGQYHQAMRSFENATRSRPADAEAWIQLGHTYLTNDETVLARNCVQTAKRLDSENVDLLMLSGYVYMRQANYVNAIDEFRHVINIDAGYGLAHYLLGLSLQADGEQEQAANSYRRALAIDPQDQLARQRLAALF